LPGRHYLVGVYDGRRIRLYIDGLEAAESPASGAIQNNDIPVVIGAYHDGTAQFNGIVRQVRISGVTRSADWIGTVYGNMADTGGFVSVGTEERIGSR